MSSVPQWNADIITPDESGMPPLASNGGLGTNASDELEVKVDGSTITINGDGELEAGQEVPAYTGSEDGKVLGVVDNGGTAELDWVAVPQELPGALGTAGQVLTVNSGATGVEWASVPQELPGSLGTAGQVLTVNSGATGVEWATPSGGGSSVSFGLPLQSSSDETACGVNFWGLEPDASVVLPFTMNNTNMGRFYLPWTIAYNGFIYVYGTSSTSYKPRWCTASNGSTTKYLEPISSSITPIASYTACRPDGSTETKSGYYFQIPAPPHDVTKVDTSVFNVVGDWSSDTAVDIWYLGFYDGTVKTWWDAGTNPNTTNCFYLSARTVTSKVWSGHGLAVNGYTGLYVTNPLPSSLGTAGQVLTVNSGATGVEWATPSGGGAGVEYVTQSNTFEEVLAAYQAGKLPVLEYEISGTKLFYVMSKYVPNGGHYLYPGMIQFSRWFRSSTNSSTQTETGNFSTEQQSCYRNSSGTTQWSRSTEKIIPDYNSGNSGQVLQVQADGTLAWVTLS